MKISSVHLRNFKRFADLSIANIPPAKLVVVTGPNGLGKSSLFDGLLQWRLEQGGFRGYGPVDQPYYSRSAGSQFERATIAWHGSAPNGIPAVRKAIDVRSSYRNEPEFSLKQLSRTGAIVDEQRTIRMIDQDSSVSKNYQRLASHVVATMVNKDSRATNVGDLQDRLFSSFSTAISSLFPNSLEFVDIGDPLTNGTFYFKKGDVERFPYMNLSGGEKAAFDLVLDLCMKRIDFDDTVFCIDEPEAHMSTRLQGKLLEELVKLVPDNSQLWIATHSIGMMRSAQAMFESDSSTVAFIDFSGHDFDKPVAIEPTKPTRSFWRNVLSVALDDVASLTVAKNIVICEGNPVASVAGKNQEHDARCYEAIFSEDTMDVDFVAAGNSSDVRSDRLAVASTIRKLAGGVAISPLVDRDDHSSTETAALRAEGFRVLSRRNLQSYLYDDEVLKALCVAEGMPRALTKVLGIKKAAVAASVARGNPPDDLKRAGGDITTQLRNVLGLHGRGNSQMALEREVLAPLIRPPLKVYADLRQDIFG